MKTVCSKLRLFGLALAIGMTAFLGIPGLASAQTPATPATTAQSQPQVQSQAAQPASQTAQAVPPAGAYTTYPGNSWCYGAGYGPGPRSYGQRGYARGYYGRGCGWRY